MKSAERQGIARFGLALILLAVSGVALAQTLYKYRGGDGEWIYSDRPPPADEAVEVRPLERGLGRPEVRVSDRLSDRQILLIASNELYAPVEVILALDELRNVGYPPPELSLRWVVPARSSAELLRLDALEEGGAPGVRYRFVWLPGDPASEHRPERPYRAPFAVANSYTVSQAFPLTITHTTVDSRYAVDIAMPIGTDVHAARGGTVVEVSGTNYRGGFDTSRSGADANLVRILHDDGTFAVYAHLNWNTIRVRPGDTVERGQYIADSGNTGFSSGPHLHFAVMRNRNLRMDSLPFVFEGPNGTEIVPQTGLELRAY
ncbi:MAG: peptidoglycan DD-metalloendopeptidase family protein [Steroidobacteraceae bacterium]